jgi:hypothetical protein
MLHRKQRLKIKKMNTDVVDGEIAKGRGRADAGDRLLHRDSKVVGELTSNALTSIPYEKLLPGDKRFGLAYYLLLVSYGIAAYFDDLQ